MLPSHVEVMNLKSAGLSDLVSTKPVVAEIQSKSLSTSGPPETDRQLTVDSDVALRREKHFGCIYNRI